VTQDYRDLEVHDGEPGLFGSDGVSALGVLSEITASLADDDPAQSPLERFLGTIVKLTGASAGAVRMITPDSDCMRLVSVMGLPIAVQGREHTVEVDCGICGAAVRDQRVYWTRDVQPCSALTACDYFGSGCKRIVAVPVQYKGQVLGIYNLFLDADRDIPPAVSLLLRVIGELLGLALENARLTRENLRVSLMNERQMLANEMHDSLAQSLHYMKMRMPLLQEAVRQHDEAGSSRYIADVNETLGTAYSSLRELLTHFRNRMDPQGLLPALRKTVNGFYDKTGIVLDFINHAPDLALPIEQELQVFHIVQEALTNIGKHSNAGHARLILAEQNGHYAITIENDGTGPGSESLRNAGDAKGETGHFGMSIMRERTKHLGGEIHFEDLAGRGTRVRLTFPAATQRRQAGS
jgi:two-component system nitrate/nitrite sensor histidine kinase NarX